MARENDLYVESTGLSQMLYAEMLEMLTMSQNCTLEEGFQGL